VAKLLMMQRPVVLALLDSRFFIGFFFQFNRVSLAWSYKGITTRPLSTEPWMVSVISSRTQSWNLGVVVGSVCVLEVCVGVSVCGVGVLCLFMNIYYSCT